MATVERVLDIARKELGTKESPANSNNVKYNTWYYGRAVSGSAYPWCMAFVQWVFAQAGIPLPLKTASCGALMNAAKKAGLWVTKDYQPGDIVIYDFSGKKSTTEHTGIVESVAGAKVTAIEGNTSQSGSQSNGGMVCRKVRSTGLIVGAVRPQYQKKEEIKMDNTPSPAHKEAVEWAKKNKILNGNTQGDLMLSQPVTRQQLCSILYNFAKSIGKA